jgi:hypothetical protein
LHIWLLAVIAKADGGLEEEEEEDLSLPSCPAYLLWDKAMELEKGENGGFCIGR